MRSLPFLAVCAALLLWGARLQQAAAAPAGKEKLSPEVKKLMEQRVAALKRAVKSRTAEVEAGRAKAESLLKLARKLRKAELELASRPADKIAAYQAYFKLACRADDLTVAGHKAGLFPISETLAVRAERLSAEIDLRQAGGTPPRDIKPPKELDLPPEK